MAQAPSQQADVVLSTIQWLKVHRRTALIALGAAAVAAGGVWFAISAKHRREAFAASELQNAQAAVSAGNVPLAINDLARLVSTYGGTAAAEEGAILLGELRLERGEAAQAIGELQQFVGRNPRPRFRGAAYNLLGAAYEQVGKMTDAAQAYQHASESWPYEYLKAQALLDAGRSFRAAGDTAQAARAYERIIRQYAESPSVLEARLRLAELRRGSSNS